MKGFPNYVPGNYMEEQMNNYKVPEWIEIAAYRIARKAGSVGVGANSESAGDPIFEPIEVTRIILEEYTDRFRNS